MRHSLLVLLLLILTTMIALPALAGTGATEGSYPPECDPETQDCTDVDADAAPDSEDAALPTTQTDDVAEASDVNESSSFPWLLVIGLMLLLVVIIGVLLSRRSGPTTG